MLHSLRQASGWISCKWVSVFVLFPHLQQQEGNKLKRLRCSGTDTAGKVSFSHFSSAFAYLCQQTLQLHLKTLHCPKTEGSTPSNRDSLRLWQRAGSCRTLSVPPDERCQAPLNLPDTPDSLCHLYLICLLKETVK